MPFTLEQFTKHATRLQVIVMSRLNRHPLANYLKLNAKEQRVFDKELNVYIRSLPVGKEEETVEEDFNTVCNEEIYPKMKPDKLILPQSSPAEIEQTEPEELHKLYGEKIEL
jgi:hypothetical protein